GSRSLRGRPGRSRPRSRPRAAASARRAGWSRPGPDGGWWTWSSGNPLDRAGSGRAGQVEPHDAGDDDGDAEERAPGEALGQEERADDDDADAGERGPQGVADADVEGQQRSAEEDGRDGAARQGGKRPSQVGEAACFARGDADRDLEDDGDTEVEPAHSGVFLS